LKQFIQPPFLAHSNIYEVNVRQYTPEGSFKAFAGHLPRLKEMGVEILWFIPVHPIGIKNRKGSLGSYYSIRDFCDINPEYGTKQDFQELIETIHGLGMKIILDWVANHAAWDNAWTVTNPDFFARDAEGNFMAPYDWTDVIQINHNNPAERQAMIGAMEYWIREFGIDGFRADLAHLTPLPFWKQAREHLDRIKKDLIWLAETEEIYYHEAFDISYTWKWMHATEELVKGAQDILALRTLLADAATEFHQSLRMYFTSNHDENSWNGTEYEKYGVYAKALAVFSCTYIHSVPLIYSGQELPNQKRLKFFEKDVIEWNNNPTLHDFYRTLLAYRQRDPVFKQTDAEGFSFIATALPVLAYQRMAGDNTMVVVLNLSKETIDSTIDMMMAKGRYKDVFSHGISYVESSIPVKLEPGAFIVLERLLP
jgi:glycosidase